jgi:hypothetical protein
MTMATTAQNRFIAFVPFVAALQGDKRSRPDLFRRQPGRATACGLSAFD